MISPIPKATFPKYSAFHLGDEGCSELFHNAQLMETQRTLKELPTVKSAVECKVPFQKKAALSQEIQCFVVRHRASTQTTTFQPWKIHPGGRITGLSEPRRHRDRGQLHRLPGHERLNRRLAGREGLVR